MRRSKEREDVISGMEESTDYVDHRLVARYILRRFESKARYKKVLAYAGGDYYILDELMKYINRASILGVGKCRLVEVFGGSGLVSQYADRSRFQMIVYNDIDSLLVQLYRDIKERPEELVMVLSLLPYSKEMYELVGEILQNNNVAGLMASALVFYLINSSYGGKRRAGFSRGGVTMGVSGVIKYDTGADRYAKRAKNIYYVAERFRDVIIDNLDFEECIRKYDDKVTLFYLDPPFIGGKDDFYGHVFSEEDARRLVGVLNNIEGCYLLKLSEDQLEYYAGLNHKSMVVKEVYGSLSKKKKWRLVLLANYELEARQKSLASMLSVR